MFNSAGAVHVTSSSIRRRRSSLFATALTLPFAVVTTVAPGTASATTTTVADTAELRAAISAFNADEDGEADTITLTSAGPYLLACGTSEDANADGDLDYTSTDGLTIEYLGTGRATIAVDQSGAGCTTERVIDVRGGASLRLEHVVISGGDLSTAPTSVFGRSGGGIAARSAGASIVLIDSVVEDNQAGNGDGSSEDGEDGGGIYAFNSTVELEDSVLRGNAAGDGADRDGAGDVGDGGLGGGLFAQLGNVTLTNSVISANAAGAGGAGSFEGRPGNGGSGGGVFVSGGDLTIVGGVIGGTALDGNSAGAPGERGGWTGAMNITLPGRAGGVYSASGDLNMTDTEVSFNIGGDAPLSAAGEGADGGNAGGIFVTGTAVLTQVNVHNNRAGHGADVSDAGMGGAGGNGGGILAQGGSVDLTIVDSTITDNAAGSGGDSASGDGGPGGSGGGLMLGGQAMTIERTTIADNRSGAGGNGTASFGGMGGDAAGVFVGSFGATRPTALIVDSSISDNTMGEGGQGATGQQPPGDGAGVVVSSPAPGLTTILRSTIAGNTGARFGGAIDVNGVLAISNSTIDSNEARDGGGALTSISGTATIEASTITDNEAPIGDSAYIPGTSATFTFARTFVSGSCHDPGDNMTDLGDNVEESSTSCGFATTAPSPQLAPLHDNGGFTLTRAPLPGSVVLDAIAAGDCTELTDQRSQSRPAGTGCDIGAVELNPSITTMPDSASGIGDELTIDVLDNDVAVDTSPDPSTVEVTDGPANGTTSVDVSTGAVTYTPTGSFEGADEFTYTVCGVGLPAVCHSAAVSINITRPDATPDTFAFVDMLDVAALSEQISNAIVVAGTNVPAAVSVVGGEYSVNGGAFTAVANSVQPGDVIRVRHTASSDPLTSVDTTLTVGGVSDTFTSTTGIAAAPAGATRFVPLTPARLLDTRDGTGAPVGKLAPGETLDVAVAGNLGVPAGAAAIVINLTVVAPEGSGFITAFPRGETQPDSSTLNVTAANQVRPNLATVPLDDEGYMSVFTLMGTHLLGDVAGYYETTDTAVADGRIEPLTPTRLLDTRPGAPGPGPKGFVEADQTISVQVAGVAGVPATGASAVVMNVTAAASAGTNFITVYPTGSPQPTASSLNLGLGEATANLVMVPLGDDGMIDFYSSAGAHLIADVTGFVTDATAETDTAGLFVPLSPSRVFDTRPGQPAPGPKGFVSAGGQVSTQVIGVAGVPADAAAVVLNVTATQAPAGFVTAWPKGVPLPNASTLNPQGLSDTRANAAILPVGDDGQIDYFVLSGAHLLADTSGYYVG